jgi:1-acyl-sn-glycerol-3-phosphate acyltransferase
MPKKKKYIQKISRPKLLRFLSVLILKFYTHTLLSFKVDINNRLPNSPRIFAVNHPTTSDPFIIYSLYPNSKVLITGEVFNVKILGKILYRLGHIPVVKGNGREAYNKAKETLLNGKDIIIFPEGKLSEDINQVERIKTGITRLALETGATVIPIGINLRKEGIKSYKVKTKLGETVVSKWYLFNKYVVNIGEGIKIKGSINNRRLVQKKSTYIQLQIQQLSRKYFFNTKN